MVTIKDVAAQAGVSIATVSRVINGKGYVSEAARARVLAAMQELGYQPNAMAQGLRRQTTRSVGVLVPRIHEAFFGTLVFAIEKTLFAQGCRSVFCSTEENPAKEREYMAMLLGQRVDAAIYFLAGEDRRENVEHLLGHGVPVVLLERALPDLPVSHVLVENFRGAYEGCRYLIELGHEHIGVISTGLETIPRDRLRGAEHALSEFGAHSDVRIIEGMPDFDTGYQAGLSMLQDRPRPTAIFALTDSIAVGVLHAADEVGVRVPEQLSVLGFDDIPLASYIIPPLTTVAQPIYRIGETAAQIVLEHLLGTNVRPQRITLPAKLTVRRSTAPPSR